jgi:hypothetical protein
VLQVNRVDAVQLVCRRPFLLLSKHKAKAAVRLLLIDVELPPDDPANDVVHDLYALLRQLHVLRIVDGDLVARVSTVVCRGGPRYSKGRNSKHKDEGGGCRIFATSYR